MTERHEIVSLIELSDDLAVDAAHEGGTQHGLGDKFSELLLAASAKSQETGALLRDALALFDSE